MEKNIQILDLANNTTKDSTPGLVRVFVSAKELKSSLTFVSEASALHLGRLDELKLSLLKLFWTIAIFSGRL